MEGLFSKRELLEDQDTVTLREYRVALEAKRLEIDEEIALVDDIVENGYCLPLEPIVLPSFKEQNLEVVNE